MAQRQRRDDRLLTVVETREVQQWATTRLSDAERQDFMTFIAGHPEDGVMMVGTDGVRKAAGVWGPVGRVGTNGTICRSVTGIACNKS